MRKKLALLVLLIFTGIQTSNSQIQFGVKGGINYNSDSFRDVKEDVLQGAKSKTGFHAGIWTRVKLPIVGFYLRPELVYTKLQNEYNLTAIPAATATYSFQKIDIPVLLGKKFLGVANVFIGPSFQYILNGDLDSETLGEIITETDGFTLGMQLGAGVEFGKFGFDVRWERAFSDTESKYISNSISQQFDTRVNQIILGVSYRL